ncbi:PEP-CTERM sorting domain-containing protein [Anabaena cylindrica UHCC 0172]|uniref:PEP-CTERM sorting domain-containing protein n=1 Tax=Anabaena cylindrica TaxID=1165 RepID=UPI002B21755E|nr:PEP-CTERM sorting domain-containing protein [Anabaena cylindrica]MEA5552380.1 PEP-CTERM sorting domain-containing protein [Anabaena cylindrica UHCC 0172]
MLRKLSIAALSILSVASIADAQSAQAASSLVNGGFEQPGITGRGIFPESAVPGWKTTDPGGIEIWDSSFGVTAYEGTQFAEINAFIDGTLFQDVDPIAAGSTIGFEFAHRARVGTDVMNLAITDLGADGIFGGGDDTSLFTKNYSATTAAWVFNTNAGEPTITTLGNKIRFAYSAVSTGSGSPSAGNFLDAVSFGVGVGASATSVPEPATMLGLLAFGAFGATSLKRKKVGA